MFRGRGEHCLAPTAVSSLWFSARPPRNSVTTACEQQLRNYEQAASVRLR